MKQLKLTMTGLVLVFFASFIVGCSDDGIDPVAPDEVTVSLRLDEAQREKAYVRLLHDGSRDDYWYYILTEDLETEAGLLLKAKLDDVLGTDGEIVGNVGVNKSILLEGLTAKTYYRVIASRISPFGELKGNVAELSFVTKRDPDVFEEYPAWSMTYKERKIGGEIEVEVFSCNVSDEDSKETYIPCLISEADFESYFGNDLRSFFEDYVEDLNKENVKWSKEVTAEYSEFIQDRLRSGKYILFMIGVDAEGELTGYYSRTDFPLAQENPTDAYSAWIGNWELSGKYNGLDISYDVEIAPDENNLYYKMYGWESLTAQDYFAPLPETRPLTLYFEKTTGYAYVISEQLPDYDELALAQFYNFYLFGSIDYNDSVMCIDVPNLKLARFSFVNSDYASATPEKFRFESGTEVLEAPFVYFNYIYTTSINNHMTYMPVTVDSKVPYISTMALERK